MSPTATIEEIRRAWLARARQLHPDATGDEDDVAMQAVNEAWYVLRDPARRAAYDRELRRGAAAATGDEPPAWEPPFDLPPEPPPGPPRAGDLFVYVAPAFLFLAVACFALGVLMQNPPLFALGLGLVALSAVAFVVTPFVGLARDRRRSHP